MAARHRSPSWSCKAWANTILSHSPLVRPNLPDADHRALETASETAPLLRQAKTLKMPHHPLHAGCGKDHGLLEFRDGQVWVMSQHFRKRFPCLFKPASG